HRFKNSRRRATGLLMLARGDKPKIVCEALGVSCERRLKTDNKRRRHSAAAPRARMKTDITEAFNVR
ncbi:MAG TPA: hypothetical protein VMJ11_32340, partial [Paraburkholderia sp.]|nr:hypothetical protein [Paraburkholderia sp.]